MDYFGEKLCFSQQDNKQYIILYIDNKGVPPDAMPTTANKCKAGRAGNNSTVEFGDNISTLFTGNEGSFTIQI